MKFAYAYLGIGVLLLLSAVAILTEYSAAPSGAAPQGGADTAAKEDPMQLLLSSPAFPHDGVIPQKYTCDGENVSPPLTIAGVPEGTQSLALIMDDPDAIVPAGKVWDHWILYDMPPVVREIPEGREPEGKKGMTSFGKVGYGGPCPPDTEHRYIFTHYALDGKLGLPEGAGKAEVLAAMEGHVLATTVLAGRYERGRR